MQFLPPNSSIQARGANEVGGLPPQCRDFSEPLPLDLPIQAMGGGLDASEALSSLPLSRKLGDNRQDVYPPTAHMLFAVMTVIRGSNAAFSRRQSIRLITAWEAGLFKFKW